jgi:hypothetical protein
MGVKARRVPCFTLKSGCLIVSTLLCIMIKCVRKWRTSSFRKGGGGCIFGRCFSAYNLLSRLGLIAY